MKTAGPGIEPLPLPLPHEPLLGDDTAGRLTTADQIGSGHLPPLDSADRALYRWVLGHHLAFGIWRMLAGSLLRALRTGREESHTNTIADWYDRYSAAQVYAGSCTEEVYATEIRPRMYQCSPAFSGLWARDYTYVAGLTAQVAPHAGEQLAQAVKRNRLVHMTLARILVPDGPSLLKEAGKRSTDNVTEAEQDLFDTFFLVHRRPVGIHEFRAHMQRRLSAIQADLGVHPVLSEAHAAVLDMLPHDLTSTLRHTAQAFTTELGAEENERASRQAHLSAW